MAQAGEDTPDNMIEQLASDVRDRGLSAPAIVLIEMLRPFGFMASQAYLLIEPLLGFSGTQRRLATYAGLLAERGNLDALLGLLARQETPNQPSRGHE